MSEYDSDGQPTGAGFNWDRRLDRGMDELIGLARGVLADGALVIEEVRFMRDWLHRNDPVKRDFFGKTLLDAFDKVLATDVLTPEDESFLVDLLLQFTGGVPKAGAPQSCATKLPLDSPWPTVIVTDSAFCFTGKFLCGTRQNCERDVLDRGGCIHISPNQRTNYLIIGELGSRDWIHSNSGRKIERAIEFRQRGFNIKIICEEHWLSVLNKLQNQI